MSITASKMLRSRAFVLCCWDMIDNLDKNIPEGEKHLYLIKLYKEMNDLKDLEKINLLYTFFEENKHKLYQTLTLIAERKTERMNREHNKFRDAVKNRIAERWVYKPTFDEAVRKYLTRV